METPVKEHAGMESRSSAIEHDVRKAREKKKSSSKGARRLMDIEKRVSKSFRRVAQALDRGAETYVEHRDKSKAKRQDGPLVDFGENVAAGVVKTINEASPIISDVAETLNSRVVRTQIRRAARTFGAVPFVS
jgi:hypothetical protein